MNSKAFCILGASVLLLSGAKNVAAEDARTAPKHPYVKAKAFHILKETHSDESGYFSLSETQDGRIHVGTAKYGHNAYLVEFNPRTEKQRIVIDAHRDLKLSATGFAAQAKIHTRNSVGKSGKVYVGTKQGYKTEEEKKTNVRYPGGYVLSYDPRTGEVENFGMPFKEQGVNDVIADEQRGALYVITCEDQHWMRYDLSKKTYQELGPMLTPYASTLIDSQGRANSLTTDFKLAQYDPATGKVTTRTIMIGGTPFARANSAAIPTWRLAADGRTAYLILMNDPTLLAIDLLSGGATVTAISHEKMIEGESPDSRCALAIAPDGRVYAIVKVTRETAFGKRPLHHLLCFDPEKGKTSDLGVLAIENPDFFDFAPGKKWAHGYQTLPDGTLTPLHHHMALIATQDGTLYATILYPFTLLKIDAFKEPTAKETPSRQYLQVALEACDRIEADIPRLTRVGEEIAKRYTKGGLMGFPYIKQTLGMELYGRSGGVMHTGFDRPWKKERTEEEKKHDVAIFGWDSAPEARDLAVLEKEKKRGSFMIGFGSKAMPDLREHQKLADVWFDTGRPADDRVVSYPDGERAGKINHLINVIYAWALTGETVAALTRQGKMPTMWKSWSYKNGRDWSEPLFRKQQYHSNYKIPPLASGEIARAYLDRMRYLLHRFERTELEQIAQAAELVAAEQRAGRKTVIASTGHMAMYYIARYDDSAWAKNQEVHAFLDSQVKSFREKTADGSLVVQLGETGFDRKLAALFQSKKQRVISITAGNPYPQQQAYLDDWAAKIDMGFAFGDACVPIPGYPIRILPTSGAMQVAAYECLNVEVFARRSDK